MTRRTRGLALAVPAGVILLTLLVAAHRWSAGHVRHMSGTESASLNCLPCHAYTAQRGPLAGLLQEDYLSPLDIAVAPDGSRLYVTAEEADLLLVVDTRSREVESRIAVGRFPHSVALSPDGANAYVSNRYSGTVMEIDLATERVSRELDVGAGPAGLALDREGRFLYVANSISNDISIVDLESGSEHRRLAAGRNPYAVGLSPDGKEVFVTNRISNPVQFRTEPVTEVTVVEVGRRQVTRRHEFKSAHMIESVEFTPRGDLALVTLARPKNLLPATQVRRGWMFTFGLGVIDRAHGGPVRQLLLDDLESFYADPYDIAISPDGRRAFVSHSGVDAVTVVDVDSLRAVLAETRRGDLEAYANHLGLSSRYVVSRIAAGPNPKGLALSPDGKTLYVVERLADRVSMISVEQLEVEGSILLGGPDRVTMVRRGQRLFHSADHTFQNQFSCRSCHPEGSTDGLSYDLEPDGLGRNIVNNLSLRELGGLAPYKWTGKNASLYRQCGFRFAKWLTRTEPYSQDELYALVAYILSLRHAPNRFRLERRGLTPTQARGKLIFERAVTNDGRPIPAENRCSTCHPPPRFTNRMMFDVGTAGPTDSDGSFDTPALNNVYESAPYLHDGRAATLEEIWTLFGSDDKHGMVSDLTKRQLNDLVEYLKSLGGAANGK
ncbi:MAG: hypothetical protein ACE5PT_05310 [Gemmatimonadales bacterium]